MLRFLVPPKLWYSFSHFHGVTSPPPKKKKTGFDTDPELVWRNEENCEPSHWWCGRDGLRNLQGKFVCVTEHNSSVGYLFHEWEGPCFVTFELQWPVSYSGCMEDETFLSRSLNKTLDQSTSSDKKRILMLNFKHVSIKTHNQSTHSDQKKEN